MVFQEIIFALEKFWAERGCVIEQPYDVEVGAGTMCPSTFLRCLGPEPWRTAYVQPSRRPQDGRYGDNPYRFFRHYQYQVLLKPSPDDVQQLYIESLKELGIDPRAHDIRFMEDDWEAPTLGAAGVGWQVWLDGLEITQFTYFQIAGGVELDPISVELTYGLERIAMALQRVADYRQVMWNERISYAQLHQQAEREWSTHGFELADVDSLLRMFGMHETEAKRLAEAGCVIPAYEQVLKCSHTFNLLDARRALSVQERQATIGRVRRLARMCARAWLAQRQQMGHPLQ